MTKAKILILSWEFPPRLVGGIARHVAELYPEVINLDYEVHLVTVAVANAPQTEQVEGIYVHRIDVEPNNDLFAWTRQMNRNMYDYCENLMTQMGDFDLIHGHDWLIADSAIPLKHRFKLPLVTTIPATEYGRNNGIHNDTQAYVFSQEVRLVYESWRVIVCSQYMKNEVHKTLDSPLDKLDIIYNGIRPEKKLPLINFDVKEFRRQFAQDDEKIIYYVGRMTYEKGVQVLLESMPKVLEQTDRKTRCVIIGGGDTSNLQNLAVNLGIRDFCIFTGFMPDEDLNKFTTIADCAVFPSLYEPFGIVVLESFASFVPVVVSDAGGLPEVVKHEKTGIVTQNKNCNSLAWGILEILNNSEYGKTLAHNAYEDLLDRFQWQKLAQQTIDVYQKVLQARKNVVWE